MTTYVISAYHHYRCQFESRSWRSVLDTTLCDKVCQWLTTSRWYSHLRQVVGILTYDRSVVFSLTTGRWYSHLRQVVGILTVLRIPPSIKLTARYNWNMVESGAKHLSSTRLKYFWKCCLALFLHTTRQCYNSHSLVTFCHASKTCVIGAFITL